MTRCPAPFAATPAHYRLKLPALADAVSLSNPSGFLQRYHQETDRYVQRFVLSRHRDIAATHRSVDYAGLKSPESGWRDNHPA